MEEKGLEDVVVEKDTGQGPGTDDNNNEDEIAIIDHEVQDGVTDDEFDILDTEDVSEKKMIQYIFKIVKDGKLDKLINLQNNFGEKKMKKWLSSRDEKFNNPFHYAAMNCDRNMMEWLLTNIKLKVEEKGQNQMVALHFAARYGKLPKPLKPSEVRDERLTKVLILRINLQKEEDRTWLAVEYLLRRTSSRSV